MTLQKAAPHSTIIVIAGPPCSGKSALAARVASSFGFAHLTMDAIRLDLFPTGDHTRVERDVAYRAMHLVAKHLLGLKCGVVLDATYFPPNQRDVVENLASRANATLHIIELHISADLAVARFIDRGIHAAIDLTADSVRYQAQTYPYFPEACAVETAQNLDTCVEQVTNHVENAPPNAIDGSWTRAARMNSSQAAPTVRHAGLRISNDRLKEANRKQRSISFGSWFRLLFILAAVLPFLAKALVIASATWVSVHHSHGLIADVSRLDTLGIQSWNWPDIFEWELLSLTVAALGSALIPWSEHLKTVANKYKRMTDAGKIARYEPVSDLRPSDESIYHQYYTRDKSASLEGFPECLRGLPVYFIIPPRRHLSIELALRGMSIDQSELSSSAAKLGLDWNGFRRWRLWSKEQEYGTQTFKAGIRFAGVLFRENMYQFSVTKCNYADYMCSELAVNLHAPNRLPDMRRFFEGPNWDGLIPSVDLADLESSARMYSMLGSISLLLTTSDGYLILQRRSRYISEGEGHLGASAAGFIDWPDLSFWNRIKTRIFGILKCSNVLKNAALRELHEELAIRHVDLLRPREDVLGAGLNLLHGRDLSFYMHFHTKLTHLEVSKRRPQARDRWEIASVVFVDVKSIDEKDGTLMDAYAVLNSQCNRHLRSALYAFARSGRLIETQQMTQR